jgi:DNA-directed RNA polymerase specialized sigma24 family protein
MEELRDIRMLKLQIVKERERAARLRSEAGYATNKLRQSASRGTAEPDIMSSQIAKLVDIEREVLAKVVEAETRISDAERAVDALPGAQRMVMRLRYFEGYDWRRVARTMHYSARRCMQIHEEGAAKLG